MKQTNQKTIERLLTNIRGENDKAFALQATMYKGALANGTSLIYELYELTTSQRSVRNK